MTDKRRTIIITLSVLCGSAMAAVLIFGRRGKLDPTDLATLFVNMLLAAAIVFGIGMIFRKKKK